MSTQTDAEREADQEARILELEYIEGIKQPPAPPIPPPEPPADLKQIPITGATSSGADGANVPANVFDSNDNNRFSVKGVGSWLQVDFGAIQKVHKIVFGWYMNQGESREYRVRLTDQNSNVITPEHFNQGGTESTLDLSNSPIDASNIKISLTSTSNTGQWFSVRYVKAYGEILNQPPQCGPNQHWDEQQQKCVDNVTPPTGNIGPDGVLQVYATVEGGGEVFLGDSPPKDKFNVSYGTGSHIAYTKKQEGQLTFFNTEGYPITYNSDKSKSRSTRLDMYAEGGIWSNNTAYDWKNNPGYLYHEAPKNIMNGEYTVYLRGHARTGNKHAAVAWKLGGRDQDDKRSLFEICAADFEHAHPYSHYDYLHFPYVAEKVNIVKSDHGRMQDDKWYGTKAVRIVDDSKKFCTFYLYEDVDPFDSEGKPKNGWVLIATVEAHGCKEYNNIPPVWASHKDLMRVDGYSNVDFALMSVRSIDPKKKLI